MINFLYLLLRLKVEIIYKVDYKKFVSSFLFYLAFMYVLMRPLLTFYFSDFPKRIYTIEVFGILMYSLFVKLCKKTILKSDVVVYGIYLGSVLYICINSYCLGGKELLSLSLTRYIIYSFPLLYAPILVEKVNLENVMNFLVGFGIVDSLISLYEFTTHKVVFNFTGDQIVLMLNGAVRTYGLNGNYFLLGEMLTICALTSLYLYIVNKKRFYFISFILILVGIFSTGTRGFYVASVLGVVLLLGIFSFREKLTKNMIIKFTIVLILISILVYIVMFSGLTTGNAYIDGVLSRIRSIVNWSTENANVVRANRWEYAISTWKDHFWFGTGACSTEVDASTFSFAPESGLLKRLVELGLVGTVIHYLSMFIPIVYGLTRSKIIQGENQDYRIYWAISIIFSLFVEDLVLQMYTGIEYATITWFLISYVYHNNQKESKKILV